MRQRHPKALPNDLYAPALVLLLWEGLSRYGVLNAHFYPPPSAILLDIAHLFRHGSILADILISLGRIVAGLLVGGLPALILGALMARSRFFYHLLHPLVALAYPLPKIALLPYVILAFGIGESAKVFIVSIGVFFLVLLNTYHGVSQIPETYFEVAAIYRCRRLDCWRYVILPGAMPAILNGAKLATGVSFILLMAAEFLGGRSGIGSRIWMSWETFQITHMLSGLVLLSLLGWGANAFWELIERLAMPWKA